KPIRQKRINNRRTLQKLHKTTQTCQHKSIFSKACGDIEHPGENPGLDAHRFGNHLPFAAPKLATMIERSFSKRYSDRSRCFAAGLLQGKALLIKHQHKWRITY